MKNYGLVILMGTLLATTLASSGAHADCADSAAGSTTCTLLSWSAIAMTSDTFESKEAYVGEVQDEAVNYLEANGEVSTGPFLSEEIQRMRDGNPAGTSLSDSDLARAILKSN